MQIRIPRFFTLSPPHLVTLSSSHPRRPPIDQPRHPPLNRLDQLNRQAFGIAWALEHFFETLGLAGAGEHDDDVSSLVDERRGHGDAPAFASRRILCVVGDDAMILLA